MPVSDASAAPSVPSGARSAGNGSLRELAAFFLRLGLTAFGGPAAHIAIMEDELVRRRGWLSREKFLDLLGASSLIPGPSSSELAIHIGYQRAGFAGLLVAGTCFILPAFAIVSAFAWAYVHFGHLPGNLSPALRRETGRHSRNPPGAMGTQPHRRENKTARGGGFDRDSSSLCRSASLCCCCSSRDSPWR